MGQEQNQIQALRDLSREIPLNGYGLPTGIYRTDMLPFHDYSPETPVFAAKASEGTDIIPHEYESVHRIAGFPSDALQPAFLPLSYDEGYPAFYDGTPFWERLPYEPFEEYSVFERYLQMDRSARSLDNEDPDEMGEVASGTRSIAMLASSLHGDGELLEMQDAYRNYYHLYYWNFRAKAYDIFKIAQHRKQQEMRAFETQDEHYILARRLMLKLMPYLEDEEDFWDMMTPKTAIDMLKTITQLQRISTGLPAGGPGAPREGSERSMELVLRDVAQRQSIEVDNTQDQDSRLLLERTLKDPRSTEQLQELIIKMSG
jgi:hypothetical protein